jgi:hypothetical protein
MSAGSFGLYDGVDLSNSIQTESSPRNRRINTLQIHHATMTSFSGLKAMMDEGGRQVSANGAMSNEGHLDEVIPTATRRAYTSASAFDNQCLTVECCNTTLGPTWGISEVSKERFARLAVDMFRNGLLDHLGRGVGGILGHFEVPGTYATACPGPNMELDRISAMAQTLYTEGELKPAPRRKDTEMPSIIRTPNGHTYSLGLGFIKHHPDAGQAGAALKVAQQETVIDLTPEEFRDSLFNFGLAELALDSAKWADVNDSTEGKLWVATWLREPGTAA